MFTVEVAAVVAGHFGGEATNTAPVLLQRLVQIAIAYAKIHWLIVVVVCDHLAGTLGKKANKPSIKVNEFNLPPGSSAVSFELLLFFSILEHMSHRTHHDPYILQQS